jgi:7-cyano-7-deazaguanine synthase
MKSVVLLSGGLDSAANLALCAQIDSPVLALTVDYGQRAVQKELRAAKNLCAYYGVPHRQIALPWLGQLGGSSLTDSSISVPQLKPDQLDDLAVIQETARAVWVPNRNGVLINLAAALAESIGAKQVVVGFNCEEATTFPDNSLEFLEKSSETLRFSTANEVRMRCYTVDWDKSRIVAELRKLAKPFPFEMVWSCYFGGERPCGECESCQRFKRATQ